MDNIVIMDTVKPKSKYSIDRTKPKPKIKPKYTGKGRVIEKIPDHVAEKLVVEVLSTVGDADWNDPANVSKTIAKIMSIDTDQPIDQWSTQVPRAFDVDRTIMVPARDRKKNRDGTLPYWICQSLIRVDDSKGNRYINYNGAKYNKIDIIYGSPYFKNRMATVAKYAGCTWNARWGNHRKEEHKLFQKTREDEESWLDKCIKPLLSDSEIEEGVGINIKDLVMIEFKRKV